MEIASGSRVLSCNWASAHLVIFTNERLSALDAYPVLYSNRGNLNVTLKLIISYTNEETLHLVILFLNNPNYQYIVTVNVTKICNS